MRTRRMAAISLDPRFNLQAERNPQQHGGIVEEIEGLIRVYRDGRVERPPIVPIVPCTMGLERGVTANDVVVDRYMSLWARVYVPSCSGKLPLLVYFHGGGFCVGSTSWSCYNEFLSSLASKANCVIISVNYRLAPENRLPAAYEDGLTTLMWVKQQAINGSSEHKWWLKLCNLSSIYLAGDSAGANIAYNVATRLGSSGSSESTILRPLSLKGTILVQPFFGGEALTWSEKYSNQPPNSALTLSASDAYWRLSLPLGANCDHPWCNPLANGAAARLRNLRLPTIMVCVSEMDILKDRNLEFCSALISAGKRVETVMHNGVGHAFQLLHNSQLSQPRTHDMMSRIKAFIKE
ncbi:probable carboxylesterase 17 [Juglans microcarpa x Juglans regia]|uniref:probable carboxylesterase 17 n=1 Tax=Juglans microcarpa x Juglans regia TaxID=2249226 RepID=UPI001B7DD578|nr:probable carboxylesterase 17 [Juglans microcarpa x Juglans regia]